LLVIVGMTKSILKPGENFLEIGAFDGNTALNIAKNIPEESKLITIDLPENTSIKAKFNYDNLLIEDENRSKKNT
jgi:predicted O-methyltransferase YrrM